MAEKRVFQRYRKQRWKWPERFDYDAIDLIPTVRPYDDPGVKHVYYRFRKIYSTIVHKTHMVFDLDFDLNRYYYKAG